MIELLVVAVCLAPLKGELAAKLTEGFYAEGTNSACGRGFSCRKAETPQSRLRRASSPFRGAKAAFLNRPEGTP